MLEQARCATEPTFRPSPARLARPPAGCPRLARDSHSPSVSPLPARLAQEAPRRRRRRVRARVSLPEPPALAAVHPRVGPGRRRVDRRSRGRRRRASSMRRPVRARRRHRPAAANRHAALVPLRQHEGPVHAADAGRRGLRGVRRVPRAERGGGTRRRDEFRRGRSGGEKRRATTTTRHPPVHPRRGEGARPEPRGGRAEGGDVERGGSRGVQNAGGGARGGLGGRDSTDRRRGVVVGFKVRHLRRSATLARVITVVSSRRVRVS